MALPTHYLKKRDTLWDPKAAPEKLAALGRQFLEREAYSDALDFFERAQDEKGIQEIKRLALRTGDTFLLTRVERYDRHEVRPEDWEAAKEAAERRGAPSMARFAENKLKPPEEAQAEEKAPGEEPVE